MRFYRLQNEHFFNKEHIIDTSVVNDITCTRQSLIYYTCDHTFFYDMTLSTE